MLDIGFMQYDSDLRFYDSSKTKDKCAILPGKKMHDVTGSGQVKTSLGMSLKLFSEHKFLM
jgi:hypothetical protein